MNKFIFSFLFAVSLISASCAISCYKCESKETNQCEKAVLDAQEVSGCDICVVFLGQNNGTDTTKFSGNHRDCFKKSEHPDIGDVCDYYTEQKTGPSFKVLKCEQCTEEKCNTQLLKSNGLAVIATIATLVMMILSFIFEWTLINN